MPKRVRQIDQLIVNSPFEEPAMHWSYDREFRLFTLTEGRRPAGYIVATEGSKSFDDPGVFVELPLSESNSSKTEDMAGSRIFWRDWHHEAATGTLARRRPAGQQPTVFLLRSGSH